MTNNGILIYAHNNEKIDYIKLSILSALHAKKNLNLPVTLITDSQSIESAKKDNLDKKYFSIFDDIKVIDIPKIIGKRNYKNLDEDFYLNFINFSRHLSWELTPYEKTLVIDSDYLIMSSNLKSYFNATSDFMIADSINDIIGEKRLGFNDSYVSFTGIKLKWATTILFRKNEKSKRLFELVKHIQENYNVYSQIYRFDTRMYRNDISFSLAFHIMNGYIETHNYNLPPILSLSSKDQIFDVEKDKIFFLCDINSPNPAAVSISNVDIHIMNKIDLLKNFDKIIEIL